MVWLLKKLAAGFVFGLGFAVALILVYSVWMLWYLPSQLESLETSISNAEAPKELLQSAPAFKEGFLGSHGQYSADHPRDELKQLVPGNAKIVGSVTDNGEPVEGFRLRLFLNGAARTPWTLTDESGQYVVKVPEGKYQVTGIEVDSRVADKLLPGRIDHPAENVNVSGAPFDVTVQSIGHGPDLAYVMPVEKISPKGVLTTESDIVAKWRPYPGAVKYEIQLYENASKNGFWHKGRVFPWRDKPSVDGPEINLTAIGVEFKEGYYYTMHVTALDESSRAISESSMKFSNKDFQVVAPKKAEK